jgi:hypothetical protein
MLQPRVATGVQLAMRSASFGLLGLIACGGAPPAAPGASSGISASPPPVEPHVCASPRTPVTALARAELEQVALPADPRAAEQRLAGIWDGHLFDLGVDELEQPGSQPSAQSAETLCFDHDGELTKLAPPSTDDDGEPVQTCVVRSRTYSLQQDPDGSPGLELRVVSSGGCPGDASFGGSYTSAYYIRRLDDRFLVLIDGSTGVVSGYRRR